MQNGALFIISNHIVTHQHQPKLNAMPELNDLNDSFAETTGVQKVPTGINVLTILTFIGSGIQILSSLWQFSQGKKSVEQLEAMQENGQLDQVPSFMKGMVGPEALEMARKTYTYRFPLLVVALLSAGLCIYGALQMRQLKKQGFYIYTIGEVLPVIITLILVGMGTGTLIFSLVIVALFIGLYAGQLKHMR
jgi:hypothetical protein